MMFSSHIDPRGANVIALMRFKKERSVHPAAKIAAGAVISVDATIGANAAIGPRAEVSGNAYVDGSLMNRALVKDSAIVDRNVALIQEAMVSGEAHVFGYTQISQNAHVGDCAMISGEVRLEGGCRVGGHARVRGDVVIRGATCIAGNAKIHQQTDETLDYQDLTLHAGVFTRNCDITSSQDFTQITYRNVVWTCYRTNKFGVYDITCDHDASMLDGGAPASGHDGPCYFPIPEFVERVFDQWKLEHMEIERARCEQAERDELDSIVRTEEMLEAEGVK